MSELEPTAAKPERQAHGALRTLIIFALAVAFVVAIIASTMGGGEATGTGKSGSHVMSDGTKMNGGMDMSGSGGR